MKHLILLASGSPRRRDILENLGFTVHQLAANIDETILPNENALDYVQRMALEKNRAARQQHPSHHNTPILSADTIVAYQDMILGKPENHDQAKQTLQILSGNTHQVLTAVCLAKQGRESVIVQTNHVQFKSLSEQDIQQYIMTGEPMDKAGAYGIQGIGGAFVSHLSGSFTGVMGLPVFETLNLLRENGVPVPPFV